MRMRTFLSVADVAEERQISRMTVYRHIAAGTLRAHRYGRALRITPQDAADWDRRCCITKRQEDASELG
jgi:excisionase family DNA binding protein